MPIVYSAQSGQAGDVVDLSEVQSSRYSSLVDVPSSGAGGAPLTLGFWVDPFTTTPLADQTGAAGAPFATLQQAVDAVPAIPGYASLFLSPGVYAAEAVNAGAKSIALLGAAPGLSQPGVPLSPRCDLTAVTWTTSGDLSVCEVAAIGDLTAAGTMTIRNSGCVGIVTGGAGLLANNSEISSFAMLGSIFAHGSIFINGGTAANSFLFDCFVNAAADFTLGGGGSEFRDCRLGGLITANDVRMWVCQFSGVVGQNVELYSVTGGSSVSALSLVADACTLADITLTSPGTSTLTSTNYNQLIAPEFAVIHCDAYSAGWVPLSGLGVRVVEAPRASLVVLVPVLAANAIGTAAALLTGTVMEGLAVDSQIVATEPTAGVAGGGFLAGVRVDAPNSVLFTFHGPTTGGNQTFQVTRV